MITIKNLSLSFLSISAIKLSWENTGTPDGNKLVIKRSDSPVSEFSEIGSVDDTEVFFVDDAPLTHRKYIPQYYKVKNPDDTYSKTVYTPFNPEKHVLEQNRLLERHLRRDVGKLSYYFRRKSTGLRCDCWDEDLGKSVISDCPDCAGTGRKKGYADPVEVYISYPPLAPNSIQLDHIKFNILTPNAWTGNYPPIYPDDVIIRADDMEVFVVEGEVRVTGRLLYPSRQMFQLRGVEHQSVEYGLIDRV